MEIIKNNNIEKEVEIIKSAYKSAKKNKSIQSKENLNDDSTNYVTSEELKNNIDSEYKESVSVVEIDESEIVNIADRGILKITFLLSKRKYLLKQNSKEKIEYYGVLNENNEIIIQEYFI